MTQPYQLDDCQRAVVQWKAVTTEGKDHAAPAGKLHMEGYKQCNKQRGDKTWEQ
jgi:hypothetical protein